MSTPVKLLGSALNRQEPALLLKVSTLTSNKLYTEHCSNVIVLVCIPKI